VTNFTVNKIYTFRSRENSVLVEVPRYAGSRLTSLLLNTVGVILLTEACAEPAGSPRRWSGFAVSLGWNCRCTGSSSSSEQTVRPRPVLALIGAVASGLAAMAVLFVSTEIPSPRRKYTASPARFPTTANVTPRRSSQLRPEAFYSENYSFLFSAQDGSSRA